MTSGAYQGTGSGDTQWDAMVANRKTLWGAGAISPRIRREPDYLTHITHVSRGGCSLSCSQGQSNRDRADNLCLPLAPWHRRHRGALAATSTYLAVAADVGQAIHCRVTATNIPFPAPVPAISDNAITVTAGGGSQFVLVASVIGLTRPTAQDLRPTDAQLRNNQPGNANQNNNHNFSLVPSFAPPTMPPWICAARVYQHSLNPYGTDAMPGRSAPLRSDAYQNGLIIYGAEVIGEQADNTVGAR